MFLIFAVFIVRWGKLVDKKGDNSNPFHSGGEDTYLVARSIEVVRIEGNWNSDKNAKGNRKKKSSKIKTFNDKKKNA